MHNFWQNYGGYVTAPVVVITDNFSTILAVVLGLLQVVYMIYKIKKAKADCKEG